MIYYIYKVHWDRDIDKILYRLPSHIQRKYQLWVKNVETLGLSEVQKSRGFHDEALKGQRQGQRSVRLSRSYRIIYELYEDGTIKILHVKEVSKHEY